MVPKDKTEREENGPQGALWAYSYLIVPPGAEDEMKAIHTFLEEEQSEARRSERTWIGKLLSERRITHILIVTDSPEKSGDANHQLEVRLKQLKLGYTRTAPMAVEGGRSSG